MWKASLELPALGASSRNASEAFVTLRPTQSSSKMNVKVLVFFQNMYTHGKQQTRRARGKESSIRYLEHTWYISLEDPRQKSQYMVDKV